MKEIGIIRNVDSLGRIGLPKELRTTMSINKNDQMEIYVNDGALILMKYEEKCAFCGNTEDVFKFKNRIICKQCVNEIIEGESHGNEN